VIDMLQEFGISQMPVSEAPASDGPLPVASLVGSISDRGLLDRAFRDPSVIERTVGEVMGRPLPLVDEGATVDAAFDLLAGGAAALVIVREGTPAGIATRVDLLELLNHVRPRTR
jgi:cystathionine beta-synthase